MKNELRLALGILSGRIKELKMEQWDLIGYGYDNYLEFGPPEWDIKERAEEIIISLFEKIEVRINLIESERFIGPRFGDNWAT